MFLLAKDHLSFYFLFGGGCMLACATVALFNRPSCFGCVFSHLLRFAGSGSFVFSWAAPNIFKFVLVQIFFLFVPVLPLLCVEIVEHCLLPRGSVEKFSNLLWQM